MQSKHNPPKSAFGAGMSMGRTSAQSYIPNPNIQMGPLYYEPAKKIETEEEKIVRYERVIDKLKKMMEHERKILK